MEKCIATDPLIGFVTQTELSSADGIARGKLIRGLEDAETKFERDGQIWNHELKPLGMA